MQWHWDKTWPVLCTALGSSWLRSQRRRFNQLWLVWNTVDTQTLDSVCHPRNIIQFETGSPHMRNLDTVTLEGCCYIHSIPWINEWMNDMYMFPQVVKFATNEINLYQIRAHISMQNGFKVHCLNFFSLDKVLSVSFKNNLAWNYNSFIERDRLFSLARNNGKGHFLSSCWFNR